MTDSSNPEFVTDSSNLKSIQHKCTQILFTNVTITSSMKETGHIELH